LTVYELNSWVLPMKIKTTILRILRDAEGNGGMNFVIIYAQKKDDSLIFFEDKRQTKGGEDGVWMRFITSSFQVSVYTNQRPETVAGRNDNWVPHHFL